MALPAIRCGYIGRVRLVALGALRLLAVNAVTGGTVKFGMLALVFPQLFNLLCMTGQTGVSDITREGNLQRGVRVPVTTEASFYFKVSLSSVALTALGNRFLYGRGMAHVTACAPHPFVLSPGGLKVGRRLDMTLHAVFIFQSGLCLGKGRARTGQTQQNPQRQAENDHKTTSQYFHGNLLFIF
jgi:hypothetical protein